MSVAVRQNKRAWGYVPLVEVWRGATVESVHDGAVAVVDSTGRLRAAVGDPGTVTFLRSSAKPAQALPLIEGGVVERFGLSDAEIALIAGSHGGEPFHVEAVRSILSKIGLDETALQCGAHPPLYRPAAEALRAAGTAPTALHNNCSGQHSGMLALAVHLGTPIETYLDLDHPVQRRIHTALESIAGLEPGAEETGVDGCSAPALPMPLRHAALIYARLTDPGETIGRSRPAARRVVQAMRDHPEMVAGTDRLCTALMRASHSGLVAKIGAEGFYGLGYEQDGRGVGIALKIGDGNDQRARNTATIEVLRQLGVIPAQTAMDLTERFVGAVRNHRGLVVGRVGSVFALQEAP
jgi:L-asparaginase II